MSALDTPGVDTLLARLLWERRAIELGALQEALAETRRGEGTLARRLVARGLAPERELEQVLRESLGVSAAPAQRVGPYLLQRRLGEGGMGVVWLGVHEATGVEVAVKTLPATSDPEFRHRFLREGEAQARVDEHPNVVRVHSAGNEGGSLYLVLDYVSGGDLGALLATRGTLSAREAAEVAQGLARGLEHVHAAGVLHRDLKPQNVLLGEDGRPRLVDFGLARLEGRTALTESGVVLGTPAYMAPEQATGDRDQIGPWTDVYGLGALLYTVLTGRPPFAGATLLGILDQVLTRAPEAPGVDADLDAICLRCLEKDPSDRYASAREVAEALQSWLDGEVGASSRPRYLGTLLGAGVLGLVLAGVGVWATQPRSEVDAPIQTPAVDRLQRGIEASEEGEWRAALRHFEDGLAEEPGALQLRLWRGRALRALKRHEEALVELTAAVRGGAAPAEAQEVFEAWVERGKRRLDSGDLGEAERSYSEALEFNPRARRARLGRAWVGIRLGRFADARDLASEEIAKDPEAYEPYLLRACARRRIAADQSAALADHDRAVELGPEKARPFAERALFYVVYARDNTESEQSVKGGRDAERALKLEPRDTLALALHALYDVRLKHWVRAAQTLEELERDEGGYQSAQAHWVRGRWRFHSDRKLVNARELALEHYSRGTDLDPWAPHINLDRGLVEADLKLFPQAELHLSRGLQVLKQGRKSMKARRERARVRLALKDRLGALADCEFLAARAGRASDLVEAAKVLRRFGYFERGLEVAEAAQRKEAGSLDARYMRARFCVELGRLKEASELASGLSNANQGKAIADDVALARLLQVDAEDRFAKGERLRSATPKLAIQLMQEALVAWPDRVEWWKAFAEFLVSQPGRGQLAARAATRVLQLEPERWGALELRARALAAEGDSRAARKDLVDFLAQEPPGPRRARAEDLLHSLSKSSSD